MPYDNPREKLEADARKSLLTEWTKQFPREAECLSNLQEHPWHGKWLATLFEVREQFVEDGMDEEMEMLIDELEEHADPYAYRGLRRSDF